MTTQIFAALFRNGNQQEPLTIGNLADWRQNNEGSKLLLPAIQRSVVWSNEQVNNYWDSLLRGYPAGMMIVHRVKRGASDSSHKGRDADGLMREANDDGFQLFDGQQRMTAVLLGFGEGQMKDNRRLWIDLGTEPNKSSGLRFQLRITSTGQPFGYRPDKPNQKCELGKRQNKWQEWRLKYPNDGTLSQAFPKVTGNDVIDARCAVPFSEILNRLRMEGDSSAVLSLSAREGAIPTIVEEFVRALKRALTTTVILQLVSSDIVADEEEYIRYFGRLGQGGTRLSDDELTYSIIKHQLPEIYDRMKEIMHGPVGRLVGEVDLVMAALRVAKTMAMPDDTNEWERIARPTPAFVARLNDLETVKSQFLGMIRRKNQHTFLESVLMQARYMLAYDADHRPKGLPTMLLARLPRELIDVLVLLLAKHVKDPTSRGDDSDVLITFVLHWILFVHDDNKAAWMAFRRAADKNWALNEQTVRNLIEEYEGDGVAYVLVGPDSISKLKDQVERGDCRLRQWTERFSAADSDGERQSGDGLRVVSTNRELIKRALMWLQRAYISQKFPDYDPTSDRDEDLPVDLDHIVPSDIFGFDWRHRGSRLQSDAISDNFRWQRGVVGDSLGNFRWLAVSENRSRGKGAYVPLESGADLVTNPEEWATIISRISDKEGWSKGDIATFQRLIDLRTLELYETLLIESGMRTLLPRIGAGSSVHVSN